MPGINGAFKGLKAMFSKNVAGKTGLYKNAAGKVKAKPGFELAKGVKGGGTVKKAGYLNMALRNPKTSLAIGAAALGGAYLYSQSGSSNAAGPQTYGYA